VTFTADEQKAAAAQGWQLCDVWCLTKKRLLLSVLPVDFKRHTAPQAQAAVVRQAKAGDQLALRALALISKSNVYKR
jgi:hypothetical protein